MKVVVVAQEFSDSGGAEKAASAHVELLERGGHAVRLVGDFARAFPGHAGLQVEGIALRRYADVAALGTAARLRMAAAGWFDARLALRVLRYLRRERPDVVHLHKVKRLSPALYVALRLARVRVVATLHDHYLSCLNSTRIQGDGTPCTLGRCSWRVAARKRCVGGSTAMTLYSMAEFAARRHLVRDLGAVDDYLFPSRFLHAWTARAVAGFKGRVVPNFAPDPPWREPVPAVRVCGPALYVGRLSPEKGVRLLPAIAARAPSLPLRVVGDGPLREWLERAARDLPAGRLEVVGPVHGDALRAEIEAASMVLLPSECFENGPLSVIEAMALARPVVASAIGGIPELVADGDTGLLHRAGDAEDAARCVRRLAQDAALRARLGSAARRAYERAHAPGRHLEALEAVYRRAAASASQRG